MRTRAEKTTLDRVRDRLRHRYLDSLPAKVSVFEQSLEELTASAQSDEAAKTSRRLAHQLCGSAASFGFGRLGALASEVERANADAMPDPLGKLVDELRRLILEESIPSSAVLVVDNDTDSATRIAKEVADPSRIVRVARSCAEARQCLRGDEFDLVILDLDLPDGDGRDLLAELREDPHTEDIAAIVCALDLSSLVKNECAIYRVESFIDKPIEAKLVATLAATALERKRTYEREAHHDDLTGLRNRAGFRQVFEQMAAFARRKKTPLSVALLDLDRFKLINDDFGHDVGDSALVEFANAMTLTLRSSDVLGRWGGEEFVIALPDTGAKSACVALGKLATVVRGLTLAPGCDRPLTFSAGVAQLLADETLDSAILRADQLLYSAKQQGRDKVLYRAEDVPRADRILIVEDDPTIASLLVHTLGTNYIVKHAANVKSALSEASQETFSLVLLDYNLPDGTGVDLLRVLREMPEYQERPLMMLTSAASDDVVEESFAAGADDYIVKPFRPRALRARIQRRLEKR